MGSLRVALFLISVHGIQHTITAKGRLCKGTVEKACLMALSPVLFTLRCASPRDVSCLRADSGRMTSSAPRGSYTEAPQRITSMLTLTPSFTEASFAAWLQSADRQAACKLESSISE